MARRVCQTDVIQTDNGQFESVSPPKIGSLRRQGGYEAFAFFFFFFFFSTLFQRLASCSLFFPPLFFSRHCTRVKAPRAVGERGWTSEKGASRTNEVQSAARHVINVAQERGTTFHPAKSVDNPSRDIII